MIELLALMTLEERIKAHFLASIEAKQLTLEMMTPAIVRAAQCITTCFNKQGKLLICGNGGSAADAQHFSGELIGRLERERPGLAAIALTTDTSTLTSIANDYNFSDIFSRQIQALGRPGDILLAISTSGSSDNILKAIKIAHVGGLSVIVLSGRDGGTAATLLNKNDIEIRVSAVRTMRIQETHLLIIHCICDLVDKLLFGKEN
jgi:D-sedoheptulose 7-phosphate isomerase